MLRVFREKIRSVGFARGKVNIGAVLVLIPLILVSLWLPNRAYAWGCSWLGIFCPTEVKAEEQEVNSQNMPLLQATLSPLDLSTSTKDLSIVSGTLLASSASMPGDKTLDNDQISLYVVHPGDTLPAIAKMFGVTVNTIRWGNDLKNNTIKVGQTLVILPISGIQHVVKSGDTLQSIAKQHKGDLDEILQYNNLSEDTKLSIGDVITIPDGEAVVTVSSGSSSGVGKTSPSISVYNGYYMRPIIGGVKTQGIHGHNAVDLASSYGAKILASADGEVIISKSSGWNGGYGEYIVIKHGNGTQTLYGDLSGTLVNVGDRVTQGQVIGYMGNSGQVTGHTGVHLHFEIRGARNPF